MIAGPRAPLLTALLGAALGLVLGLCGFSSPVELRRMLLLRDARLLLTFGGAVILLGPIWRLLGRRSGVRWQPRPLHPGSLPGGLLFGAGWALCGACPGTIFVQLGAGQGAALYVLAGALLGNLAFGLGQGRIFRFSTTGSCGDQ